MYGKHFSSMYSGSMMGAGPVIFSVWGYVISCCRDGVVELNPKLVAVLIGCSVEEIEAAIEYLCAEDPNSRNSDEGGRRLVKTGSFSYRVVSHAIYRAMRDERDRREYNRKKQAEYRAEKRSARVPTCTAVYRGVPQSSHTEAEAEAEADTESSGVAVATPVSDATNKRRRKRSEPPPYDDILEEFVRVLGRPAEWTDKRRRHAAARWRDETWRARWQEALGRAAESSFCNGGGATGWIMDLEFFLRPDTVTKLLEGKYDDRDACGFTAEQKRERANAGVFDRLQAAADRTLARLGSSDENSSAKSGTAVLDEASSLPY